MPYHIEENINFEKCDQGSESRSVQYQLSISAYLRIFQNLIVAPKKSFEFPEMEMKCRAGLKDFLP